MMIPKFQSWKNVLAGVAVLLAFFTFSNTALAAPCNTNCLSIYSITLVDRGTSIDGTVKLIDDEGTAGGARSAVVHALWTRPDGSTMDQYDVIGTRLRAEFSLQTGGVPGTYKLTVVDVTKAGYEFDDKNNTESITVGGSGNEPPVAVANADILSGEAPLTVSFESAGSFDPEGGPLTYAWDFGDLTSSSEADPIHVYEDVGEFQAVLTVTDDEGASASSSVAITVSDSNLGCTSNCLTVDQVAMAYKKKTGLIKGKVTIRDENGGRVINAQVRVEWTLPNGSQVSDIIETSKRSIASSSIEATESGVYILTVIEVLKTGYTFDADGSNVLSGMIDIKQ